MTFLSSRSRDVLSSHYTKYLTPFSAQRVVEVCEVRVLPNILPDENQIEKVREGFINWKREPLSPVGTFPVLVLPGERM